MVHPIIMYALSTIVVGIVVPTATRLGQDFMYESGKKKVHDYVWSEKVDKTVDTTQENIDAIVNTTSNWVNQTINGDLSSRSGIIQTILCIVISVIGFLCVWTVLVEFHKFLLKHKCIKRGVGQIIIDFFQCSPWLVTFTSFMCIFIHMHMLVNCAFESVFLEPDIIGWFGVIGMFFIWIFDDLGDYSWDFGRMTSKENSEDFTEENSEDFITLLKNRSKLVGSVCVLTCTLKYFLISNLKKVPLYVMYGTCSGHVIVLHTLLEMLWIGTGIAMIHLAGQFFKHVQDPDSIYLKIFKIRYVFVVFLVLAFFFSTYNTYQLWKSYAYTPMHARL
jgi:hypothetical protein